MKRKIAIVAGGDSSENPVSLRSAATILEYMDKDKYEPYILEIEGKNWQVHVSEGVSAGSSELKNISLPVLGCTNPNVFA